MQLDGDPASLERTLGTGQQVRVTPDGAMQPVSTADNGPDGYADYSIPFAGGGDKATSMEIELLQIPKLQRQE